LKEEYGGEEKDVPTIPDAASFVSDRMVLLESIDIIADLEGDDIFGVDEAVGVYVAVWTRLSILCGCNEWMDGIAEDDERERFPYALSRTHRPRLRIISVYSVENSGQRCSVLLDGHQDESGWTLSANLTCQFATGSVHGISFLAPAVGSPLPPSPLTFLRLGLIRDESVYDQYPPQEEMSQTSATYQHRLSQVQSTSISWHRPGCCIRSAQTAPSTRARSLAGLGPRALATE
jgi:hypothetical protein